MLEMQTRAIFYLFQAEGNNTVVFSPRKGQQPRLFDPQNLTRDNSTEARAWFGSKLDLCPTRGSKLLSISHSFRASGSVNARHTRVISSE
jgi:hypothetical protein